MSGYPQNPDHAHGTCPRCGKETVLGLVDGTMGKVEITVHKDTGRRGCADSPDFLNAQDERELNQQMFEIRLGWY